MKILCICPIGIGNYIMCYSAFYAIKKNMPNASLNLLALRHSIKEIAYNDALWDEVIAFDPDKIKKDFRNILSSILTIIKIKFDVSLCFFPSNSWQYNFLPFLCRIKKRYAFRYKLKRIKSLSFLNTKRINIDINSHDIFQNLKLAEFFLNKQISKEEIVFPCLYKEEHKRWAIEYLSSIKTTNKIFIAVHPGSSLEHGMEAKRWPPDNFACLLDYICEFLSADALIFGSKDESEIKSAVFSKMKKRAHIIEPVDISKTAALISHCFCCIANDSGIMHIAASMNIPTCGIFGPTDEKRNGPYGKNNIVVRKKMNGFPLWTAENVGERFVPNGVDPKKSLNELSSDEAWIQIKPWLEKLLAEKNIINYKKIEQ